MEKRGITLLIVIILISLVFVSAETTPNTEEIEKLKDSIVYIAEQVESNNIGYSTAIVKIGDVEEKLNTQLGSEPAALQKKVLIKTFGASEEETTTALDEKKDTQKKIDPVPVWKKTNLFDGNQISVQANIIPVIRTVNGKETVTYEISTSTILSAAQPDINTEIAKSKIQEIEDSLKGYMLNPSDLAERNKIAITISTLQQAFNKYINEKGSEECANFFSKVLGDEYRVTNYRIISKEYTISKGGDVNTILKMTYCEKCEDNWITLEVEFRNQNGDKLDYLLLQQTPSSLFENYGDVNEFKSKFIDSFNKFIELNNAKSYRAANTMGNEMEVLNTVWEGKFPTPSNFLDQLTFYESALKEFSSKMEFTDQQTWMKPLTQKIEEGKEEICNNKIDDNQNNKIDCEDPLCGGEVCGTKIDENNQVIELYCIESKCQEKEKPKEIKNTTCGNNVCDEGEIETCISDCVTCPERESIACEGKVMFKGYGPDGCPLKTICLEESDECKTNEDCKQPPCGTSQCIEGKCQVTELKQCTQAECTEGEKRTQLCQNKETIITEICANNNWKSTGQSCQTPSNQPIQVLTEEKGQQCVKKEDCLANEVCSDGTCRIIPVNIKKESEIKETSIISGTSFTGNAVEITGGMGITSTGITGVTREDNPSVLEEPQDYNIERKGGSGASFFTTSINPTKSEEEKLSKIPPKTTDTNPIVEIPDELTDGYYVIGICKTTNEGKETIMVFDGGGKNLAELSSLKKDYDSRNPEYCKIELTQAIEKRKAFKKSFNNEFAKKFFEEIIAYDSGNWEAAKGKIITLFNEITNNQEKIMQNMDCLGLKELADINPIEINYQNNYGSLIYTEKKDDIKLDGMGREVKGLTPSIEVSVSPSTKFIKESLQKAEDAHKYFGSTTSSSEREKGNGFTTKEIKAIEKDEELVKEIKELASTKADWVYNFRLTITDNSQEKPEEVYNVYGVLDQNGSIKLAPMTSEQTPAVDAEITVGFNELLDVIKKSEDKNLKLTAPWNQGITPVKVINSAKNYIETKLSMQRLASSLRFNPKDEKFKDVVEKIFYIMADKNQQPSSVESEEIKTFWNQKGEQITLN